MDVVDIVHLRAKSLGKFQPFGEQFNNMEHRRPVLASELCNLSSKKVAMGTLIQIFLGNSDISSGSWGKNEEGSIILNDNDQLLTKIGSDKKCRMTHNYVMCVYFRPAKALAIGIVIKRLQLKYLATYHEELGFHTNFINLL